MLVTWINILVGTGTGHVVALFVTSTKNDMKLASTTIKKHEKQSAISLMYHLNYICR